MSAPTMPTGVYDCDPSNPVDVEAFEAGYRCGRRARSEGFGARYEEFAAFQRQCGKEPEAARVIAAENLYVIVGHDWTEDRPGFWSHYLGFRVAWGLKR